MAVFPRPIASPPAPPRRPQRPLRPTQSAPARTISLLALLFWTPRRDSGIIRAGLSASSISKIASIVRMAQISHTIGFVMGLLLVGWVAVGGLLVAVRTTVGTVRRRRGYGRSLVEFARRVEVAARAARATRAIPEWEGWRPFRVAAIVDEARDVKSFYLSPVDGRPLSPFAPGPVPHVSAADLPGSASRSCGAIRCRIGRGRIITAATIKRIAAAARSAGPAARPRQQLLSRARAGGRRAGSAGPGRHVLHRSVGHRADRARRRGHRRHAAGEHARTRSFTLAGSATCTCCSAFATAASIRSRNICEKLAQEHPQPPAARELFVAARRTTCCTATTTTAAG